MKKGFAKRTPTIWKARQFCLSCGKCCQNTEMILLSSDISKLRRLGFRVSDFAVFDGRYYRLKNVDGRCFFYDSESGKCRIYDFRPLGCSMYPIVYDVSLRRLVVDDECPLAGETLKEELIRARKYLKVILKELRIR